jgi:hypothetical protein
MTLQHFREWNLEMKTINLQPSFHTRAQNHSVTHCNQSFIVITQSLLLAQTVTQSLLLVVTLSHCHSLSQTITHYYSLGHSLEDCRSLSLSVIATR